MVVIEGNVGSCCSWMLEVVVSCFGTEGRFADSAGLGSCMSLVTGFRDSSARSRTSTKDEYEEACGESTFVCWGCKT